MLKAVSLLLCLQIFGALAAVAVQPTAPSINLEVNVKELDAQPSLSIKLTNIGESPLKFAIGAGPWAGEGKVQLVAIKYPFGIAIPNELQAMVDPALGPMELQPGQSKAYDVPLHQLYPELAEELRAKRGGKYVLFWTYQMVAWDKTQSARLGGWLEFENN